MEEDQNKGFDNLKRNRGKGLSLIKQKVFDLRSKDRFDLKSESWFRRDRIRDSLCCEEVDNGDLWNKIDWCGVKGKKKCGSLWCKRCRDIVSRIFEKRIYENIDFLNNELKNDGEIVRINNDDLFMLSGVVGISKIDEDDIIKSLNWDSNRWKRIKRRIDKLDNKYFIELSYEFELVNGMFLMSSVGRDNEYKKKCIRQLKEVRKDININDVFVFVHFHCISNMDSDVLKSVCGSDFYVGGRKLIKNNDCGLYVRKFIGKNEFDKNIKKVSNYSFKDVFRFKYDFVGSNYLNGEYLNNEELGKLISLYDRLSGRGYRRLFKNISNFDIKKDWIVK